MLEARANGTQGDRLKNQMFVIPHSLMTQSTVSKNYRRCSAPAHDTGQAVAFDDNVIGDVLERMSGVCMQTAIKHMPWRETMCMQNKSRPVDLKQLLRNAELC